MNIPKINRSNEPSYYKACWSFWKFNGLDGQIGSKINPWSKVIIYCKFVKMICYLKYCECMRPRWYYCEVKTTNPTFTNRVATHLYDYYLETKLFHQIMLNQVEYVTLFANCPGLRITDILNNIIADRVTRTRKKSGVRQILKVCKERAHVPAVNARSQNSNTNTRCRQCDVRVPTW